MRFQLKEFIAKIRKPFQQGLQTKEVINAVIVSLLFTVIPIIGLTTITLTFISLKKRLNFPIMIVISYLAAPLQFILFLPFIYLGEQIFNVEHSLLNLKSIKMGFSTSFWATMKSISLEIFYGLTAWFLIAIPISILAIFINEKISKVIQNQKK
ncbi:MAG: DUF2062 domain-containing protein [Flavobacteriia bacterium]|nr:DUF2062 domain-containing protein [Flavobacteriia bacterium]OIP46260.1 MAG: hypothetical protein AUK46_08535 [Flavobacteriaceae bacterium CG2_30_31_66]PIV95961.1 MAG: DUF2062 domain-containing protein [Flavobacteriaceae bacterium CG17_big_fil_post_rev_8_21_14_2_50_31_13]PIX13571.1 MAG: DUF2062 domain-containing protein [Flavobacteriaceae bacterium CG_4_8_14_3_um_filter_31_8]PIY16296.1 MAG: DUF2062 domain-containing protein [Flavobacteriaceae bacterium CG_4_10_14_3_um_filter_31_253]PIZ11957.